MRLILSQVTRTPAADRRSAFDAWLAGSKPWPSYPHLHARAHRLLVKTSSNIGYVPEICYVHPTEEWNDGLPVAIGGFADVYRAELNGHTVALKKLRVFSSDMTDQGRAKMKMLCREAMIWQHLEHPNILQFLGIDCDLYAGQWCLVSLWMENGTIMRYLKKRQPPADVNVINYMLYEIAQGLAYLRWENIVHGDLRGANIMIDEYHHVRLTDFGLASFAETTRGPSAQTGKGGSIQFMAPELHDPMRFGFPRYETTPSTDMYAFACVCYEMYTGHAPWHKEEKHDAAVILRVCKGDRPVRPTPEECSGKVLTEEVWRLIDACWTQAANKRPDVREIARFLASILQPMVSQSFLP
ncbi:kinase-like protein [Heliocybe sulcata]|uniref:Kinase-like protein n=1 Tax=Heliocybe sulcata TaxID=5364 RepID=A0A5C3MU57_9AGAM|nr:kinase-like protein [Heliocybe sulcata]